MRIAVLQVIAELAPLRGVDVESSEVCRRYPSHVAGFVVGCRRSAGGTCHEHDLILLAYFTVGVGDDVGGVGIYTENSGSFDEDAGFFLGLPYRALGWSLAEVHLAHRQRPLAGVAATLKENPSSVIDGQHAARGHEAVRFRRGRVSPILDPSHSSRFLTEPREGILPDALEAGDVLLDEYAAVEFA